MSDGADGAKKKKAKKSGGDRTFRRLDAQDAPVAPLPVAWAFGMGLGVLGGLAACAWDVAVLERARIPVWTDPIAERALPWVVGYAALGAGIGLASGATGLFGGRWASAAAMCAMAWWSSPVAARFAEAAGAPSMIGVVAAMALAWVAGQLGGRLPVPAAVHGAFAALLFTVGCVAAPLAQHLVSEPFTGPAVGLWLVIALFCTPFAAICALTARDGRPPVTSVATVLSLGMGAALTLRPAGPTPLPTGVGSGAPIVFVALDGVRDADLASLPSLGALARRSTAYTSAWSTSNWAVPAVGSALTGRWPYDHQAGLNVGLADGDGQLDPRIRTTADQLGALGYARIGVTSDPSLRTYGLDRGFQVWLDHPAAGASPAAVAPLAAAGFVPEDLRSRSPVSLVTDRAIAALAQPGGTFLFVHHAELRSGRGDVATLDAELARLFASIPQNAWVFVFGTHGRGLGDGRTSLDDPRADGMLAEWVRVPLIVAGPGVTRRAPDRVVSLVDLQSTIAALLGDRDLGADVGLVPGDGAPLAEVFGSDGDPARLIFAQSNGRGPERQLVIAYPHALLRAGANTALFDLSTDPALREAVRVDPSLDPVERKLEAALPTDGAPAVRGGLPDLTLSLGQLATRAWGEGR